MMDKNTLGIILKSFIVKESHVLSSEDPESSRYQAMQERISLLKDKFHY